jgi:hypothetical protein
VMSGWGTILQGSALSKTICAYVDDLLTIKENYDVVLVGVEGGGKSIFRERATLVSLPSPCDPCLVRACQKALLLAFVAFVKLPRTKDAIAKFYPPNMVDTIFTFIATLNLDHVDELYTSMLVDGVASSFEALEAFFHCREHVLIESLVVRAESPDDTSYVHQDDLLHSMHWLPQLDDALRVLNPSFIPTKRDFLYLNSYSAGIVETFVPFKGKTIRIVDLPSRFARKRWLHCFFDMDAFVLFVDLAKLHLPLYANSTKQTSQEWPVLMSAILRFHARTRMIVIGTRFDELVTLAKFDEYQTLVHNLFCIPHHIANPHTLAEFMIRRKAVSILKVIVCICYNFSFAGIVDQALDLSINGEHKVQYL